MRLLVFLFFAVGLQAADIGSPIPFPREERASKPDCDCTNCDCKDGRRGLDCTCKGCKCAIVTGRTFDAEATRPSQKNSAATGTTAKKGCPTCGVNCRCVNCQCDAENWRSQCEACPIELKRAYMQQLSARSVPAASPFGQAGYSSTPTINATVAGGYSSRSMGTRPMGNIGIGAPAGMFGNTSSGCPTGG